jgi:hypothetical protein
MRTMRMVMVGLAVVGGVAAPAAYSAQPPKATARPVPFAVRQLTYFDGNDRSKLTLVKEDPLRKGLLEKLGPTSTDVAPDSKKASEVLESMMGSPGASVGPILCSMKGCYADVDYESVDALKRFDKAQIVNRGSKFALWGSGAGRTSLLRTENNRLMATWYVVNPVYGTYRPQGGKEGKQ